MRRIKRMGHGARLARNLLLLLLLGVLLWGLLDFPAPTLRGRFRMAEEANWAGPSDIQGVFDSAYDRWVAAACEDQVLLWREGEPSLEHWPRAEEGATLVPVPEPRSARGEVQVVAADVPEGTASARLELTMGCWYKRNASGGWTFGSRAERPGNMPPLTQRWERTYTAQGLLLEDGAVLFQVAAEEEQGGEGPERLILSYAYEWDLYWKEGDRRAVDAVMEAVFYDEAGRELGRAVLATTEQGGAPWTGG